MDRPKRTKFAIVGYTAHMMEAPFDDHEWEIWSLNDHYYDLPIFQQKDIDFSRFRWFQTHAWEYIRDWDKHVVREGDMIHPHLGPAHPRDPNHLLWLKDASQYFPIYLRTARPNELPDCLEYPWQQVLDHFAPYDYLTNSISIMQALAIMELSEKVTLEDGQEVWRAKPGAELGIWGVDMMVSGGVMGADSEYGYQRPSCEWLLGVAIGRGIPLHIPETSDLLKCAAIYGSEDDNYFRRKLQSHYQQVEAMRVEAAVGRERAREAEMRAIGAKETIEYLFNSHMPGDPGIGQVPRAGGHKIPRFPGFKK